MLNFFESNPNVLLNMIPSPKSQPKKKKLTKYLASSNDVLKPKIS